MEHKRIFQPPPFLGVAVNSNSQIRKIKNNSLPHLASHRSLQPSSSHTSPSLSLVTSRGTPSFSPFTRTNLTSHRRRHLRLCWDLLHICIQRRRLHLAAKFLRVILGAHEWASDEGWRIALLLLALSDDASGRSRCEWLQTLDRESSSHFKAAHTTYALVSEYIASNQLSSAIELLEQRVNVYPYRSRPELHCTLGMLYVMVGVQTLLSNGSEEEREREGVSMRSIDRATKTKARRCFEAALQSSGVAEAVEVSKRQRVYFMGRKERQEDAGRLKRGEIWGRNPMDEEDVDAWPVEPRSSSEDESGEASSARNPSSPITGEPMAASASLETSKGAKAWAKVWPEVSAIYTPERSFAVVLAREFLDRLTPGGSTQSQRSKAKHEAEEEDQDENGEEAAVGMVGAIELTQEEAERRIRGILFEDAPHDVRITHRKKERKDDKRKHKHSHSSHSRHRDRKRRRE